MMRFIRKYLKYSQAFDQEITYNDLISHLSLYNRSEVLRFLSRLGAFLTNEGTHRIEVQNYLRDTLFTTWTASQIASKQLAYHTAILFSPHQVLNLIKLSIIHCNEEGRRIIGTQALEDFVKICLKMNNYLEPEEQEIAGIQDEEVTKRRMSEFAIKNLLLHTHRTYQYMLGRYRKLFIEIPLKLSTSTNYFDIPQGFKDVTGFDLGLYVAFGIITIFNLMRITMDTIAQENIPIAIDKRTHYSNVESVNKQVAILLKQVCLPIADYKNALEKERDLLKDHPKEYFEYSFLTLEKYPLVELEDGRILCLSLDLMLRKITENVYWIILDGLSEGKKLRFLTFVGEVFHDYMASTLKRIYGDRFVQMHYGKSQNEAADGIAIYPQELVLFEAKTSRLLLRTRRSGDIDLFTDDVRDVITKGSKQLDKVITDFKKGKFRVNSFGAKNIRRFYPVIVTLVTLPQSNLLRETYERILISERLLQEPDIERLSIIDIEELEILEPILDGADFLSILKQWHSTKELRDWGLNNYLYEKYRGSFRHNEELKGQFKKLVDDCIALFKQN